MKLQSTQLSLPHSPAHPSRPLVTLMHSILRLALAGDLPQLSCYHGPL